MRKTMWIIFGLLSCVALASPSPPRVIPADELISSDHAHTQTLQYATDTVADLGQTQTFTGVDTFSASGTAVSVTNNLSAGTCTVSTSVTDPLLIGGSSSSSSLILESTSGSGSTDYIAFKTASQSEKMRITDAGNVGIGTTNPTTALYVSGTATATTFSGAGTSLTGTASSLTCGNVTTNANLTGPITSSGNATSIASQTGTGTTFAMSASPNFTGNVGIGTTNPVDALEINGSALVDNTFGVGSTNSSAALVYLGGGTNPLTGTTQMGIESNYTANSSATTAVRGVFSQNNTAASLATGLSVNFYANGLNLGASSSSTRHIDFFSNGANNHTATDNASLSDNNTFTGNYFIYQTGTDSSSFGGQLFAPNMTNNGTGSTAGEVCWVTSTGKLVYDTSGTCFASSREVKQNIESLDGSAALAEIMAFRPVIFEYKPENTVKEDVGHKHLGLIAEEVNEIDKRLVKYKSDGVTPSGVKYQEFVSPLIASVQEQQKEIEELRAEIKELKRRR